MLNFKFPIFSRSKITEKSGYGSSFSDQAASVEAETQTARGRPPEGGTTNFSDLLIFKSEGG
ncbi:MAG: hypothetical protein B6245_18670 [Desulfobacteraceae bacterium 4572_88]|nr:MAG: hypothetical protein B6245_18670 [Desulfobacteraceae bacterium 4572_88]